jgi:hypothetical protein
MDGRQARRFDSVRNNGQAPGENRRIHVVIKPISAGSHPEKVTAKRKPNSASLFIETEYGRFSFLS